MGHICLNGFFTGDSLRVKSGQYVHAECGENTATQISTDRREKSMTSQVFVTEKSEQVQKKTLKKCIFC